MANERFRLTSLSSLAQRIGNLKQPTKYTPQSERPEKRKSNSGSMLGISSNTSGHTGQRELLIGNTGTSQSKTGNTNSTQPPISSRLGKKGKEPLPSGFPITKSKAGEHSRKVRSISTPSEPPSITKKSSKASTSINNTNKPEMGGLTPLMAKTLKRKGQIAGKRLPSIQHTTDATRVTQEVVTPSTVTQNLSGKRMTISTKSSTVKPRQKPQSRLPPSSRTTIDQGKTEQAPKPKKRKKRASNSTPIPPMSQNNNEIGGTTKNRPMKGLESTFTMTKTGGILEPMIKGVEEPKSLKRKSSGLLQKIEKKRPRNTKGDVSTKPSGTRNKADNSGDTVPSKMGSPIITPHILITSPTPPNTALIPQAIMDPPVTKLPETMSPTMLGSLTSESLQQNPGGRIEDEIDFDSWWDENFLTLEMPETSELSTIEKAVEKGNNGVATEEEKPPTVAETVMPVVTTENNIVEGEEILGSNNIEFELIPEEEFNNFLTRVNEAKNIAETLHIYLKTYDIGFVYLITNSSYISMTSVEDLESSLALGDESAKRELLAQYEILMDRVQQIKRIRRERNF